MPSPIPRCPLLLSGTAACLEATPGVPEPRECRGRADGKHGREGIEAVVGEGEWTTPGQPQFPRTLRRERCSHPWGSSLLSVVGEAAPNFSPGWLQVSSLLPMPQERAEEKIKLFFLSLLSVAPVSPCWFSVLRKSRSILTALRLIWGSAGSSFSDPACPGHPAGRTKTLPLRIPKTLALRIPKTLPLRIPKPLPFRIPAANTSHPSNAVPGPRCPHHCPLAQCHCGHHSVITGPQVIWWHRDACGDSSSEMSRLCGLMWGVSCSCGTQNAQKTLHRLEIPVTHPPSDKPQRWVYNHLL